MTGAARAASVEVEAALLLSATRARRAHEADGLRALLLRSDPARLADVLAFHRALTLLGTRAVEALGADAPESLRERVGEALRTDGLRAMLLDAGLGRVCGALEDAGIPALPLKGTSLARAAHGDPAMRRSCDLDVLVPRAALPDAVGVLRRLGYDAPADPRRDDGLPELHFHLEHGERRLPPVELHWRVHWVEESFSAAMLARSAGRGPERLAAPEDAFVALLLFLARDGFAGLRLLADIAAWWDLHHEALPADVLAAAVRAHPSLRRALECAAAVVEDLVAVPARSTLGPVAPDRRRELARRLVNWELSGTEDEIVSAIALVDGLLVQDGGLRDFVRRRLVVSEAVLQDFYHLPPEARARLLFWRYAHPPKFLARFALVAGRARARRPSTAQPQAR